MNRLHVGCFVCVLVALTLASLGGCPQLALNAEQASGTDFTPGTYTGDVDFQDQEYSGGELVYEISYSVPLSVMVNEKGQWLSDLDGTPLQAGYSGQFTLGDIVGTKTITSCVSVSDSITVRGTFKFVLAQQPDNPVVGMLTMTCKKLTDSSIDYTEFWSGESSASYPPIFGVRMNWDGTLTR